MIGTRLVEELVQAVALSHRIKDQRRVSLLLLAAPESGKTTVTTAAHCPHVCQVAVISGLSVVKEVQENRATEFLLFNDLTAIRAMSNTASNLLIVLLNQFTQAEKGKVAFAGKETAAIARPLGVIACLPFETFVDHRARWKELGFVSRMIPFAYSYSDDLIARIKDSIETGASRNGHGHPRMPKASTRPVAIAMAPAYVRAVRHLADARARRLKQLGIRLLQNYHSLIRAHALLKRRKSVTKDDLDFLRAVDNYVSITDCEAL